MKIVFLDRDGTLIQEPADKQVDTLEKLSFVPGIVTGLQRLVRRGYSLVMVTNQDHLGTKSYPKAAYDTVQAKIVSLLAGEGIRFEHILVCPHGPDEGCACRKPRTGLVDELLRTNGIDRQRSWVLGDRETDVDFARAIGCRSVRLTTDAATLAEYHAPEFASLCSYILRNDRFVRMERRTSETNISLSLSLDTGAKGFISTGIGFFDHMLTQIATHAGIDLMIRVQGDLHVDEHHTVEDTGRALGEAIREALGGKAGIGRFGFVTPLDESLAQVAIDLSGRPYCRFDAAFQRERVGELPTELVEEFFRAFSDGLRATIHVKAEGTNDHHKIESLFKATARALKQAIARNDDDDAIPSSKGSL